MPAESPPKNARPDPKYQILPPGSFLWRVTSHAGPAGTDPTAALAAGPVAPSAGPPSLFRPAPDDPEPDSRRWGGRFDPTPDCPYPYCYAATDELTALCERLLRDMRFDTPSRFLPAAAVDGLSLVLLETRRPLALVSLLDAADLAAANQDPWLLHADFPLYHITQQWAHWLRDGPGPDGMGAPDGLIWLSHRQPTGRAVLLFGDRCGDELTQAPFAARRLDTDEGRAWLNRRLSILRTKIDAPRTSAPPPAPTPPAPAPAARASIA